MFLDDLLRGAAGSAIQSAREPRAPCREAEVSSALAICHGPFGRACLYRIDRPFVTHAHREGHLVFHVGGAPATLLVDGRPFPVGPGTAVAIDPWQPHAHRPIAPGAEGTFLVLYVRPAWFLEASRRANVALRFGCNGIALSPPLVGSVARVAGLLMEPCPAGQLANELSALVQDCFDHSWGSRAGAPPRAERVLLDFRIRKALKLIGARLDGELPFDRVARDAGLSRSHFYKMFKSQLGVTPAVYLNTLRVECALEQLIGTRRSVTEIGQELGFTCQSSFTRFFAAHVGLVPTDYRRRARLL